MSESNNSKEFPSTIVILIIAGAFVLYRLMVFAQCIDVPANLAPCLQHFHLYIAEFVIAVGIMALVTIYEARRSA